MRELKQEQGYMDLVIGIRAYQEKQYEVAARNWGPWATQQDDILGCFARSLSANLGESEHLHDNLYCIQHLSEERQIELFDQLSRLPLVSWPREITEHLYCKHGSGALTHIELGIGSGDHARQLVQAGRASRVIGIDVDPSSVERSAKHFADSNIEYIPIAQPFEKLDWAHLRSLAQGQVTVNAAFALHHLSLGAKRNVIAGIASLAPRLATLIEPSSAHWSADLLTRFVHAYSHFQIVGDFVGKLDTSREVRRGLLQFFGREITDIMRDSPDRFERHEQWSFWYGELLRSGLDPLTVSPHEMASNQPIFGFQVDPSAPGVVTLSRGATPLVSVLAFESRASRP